MNCQWKVSDEVYSRKEKGEGAEGSNGQTGINRK